MGIIPETLGNWRKRFGMLIVKYHATIIASVALLGVVFVAVGQQTLITRYEYSLRSLQYYDIRVGVFVTNMDFSNRTLPIPQDGKPFPDFNNDSTVNNWLYIFERADLDINATFRFVYLRISIPERAYWHFGHIDSTWFIEDSSGILRRESYTESRWSANYFDAEYDISRFMWKDDVPSEIRIETTLYA